MIVQWECGCVGISSVVDPDGSTLVLRPCEGDIAFHDLSPHFRNMRGKGKVTLSHSVAEKLIDDLTRAVNDGNRLRAIKAALG
jgi:hypothetical protein